MSPSLSQPETLPRTPRRRRWLRGAAVVLLVSLAAGGARYWLWHRQVADELAAALARLDADEPGWRLADLEAAREVIPEEENSARVVVAAGKQLPSNWPPRDFYAAFERLDPPKRLDRAAYGRLCGELDAVRPALAEALRLVTLPRGRHRIEYQPNPLDTLLGEQLEVRRVAALLRYEAIRCGEEGDRAGAVAACRAALNAARSVGDEPVSVTQLVRHACAVVACGATERTLAQGESPADGLAALQRLFEDEDAFPLLLVSARGERAQAHAFFELFEGGGMTLAELAREKDPSPSWPERLYGWLIRDMRRAEHPLALSLATRRVNDARTPPHEQAAAEQRFRADCAALPPNAVFTRLLLPATVRLGEAERRRHAKLRSLIVCLAAERFRLAEGRWPTALADLVPGQLAAAPLDPFDGKPLRYRRLPDGVAVYSVGPDGTDDGGTFDPEGGGARPGTDIGCRLWDVDRRGRPPEAAAARAGEGGGP